jgi:hypothetical protein
MEIVVSLSDLHLGAFNTTWRFFNDYDDPLLRDVCSVSPPQYSKVRARPGWAVCEQVGASILQESRRLGTEFRQAHRRTLVLNGDILDLSLSPTSFACLNARCFFQWVGEFGFDRVVYVPGNHDHHLWRMVIEEAALANAVKNGDSRYSRTSSTVLAGAALKRLLDIQLEFDVVYPHYVHCLSKNVTKAAEDWYLVFHHGHLLEHWWTLLSTLVPSAHGRQHTLEELESINEPLTELLWFGVGDAGRLSDVISQFYSASSSRKTMRLAIERAIGEAMVTLQRRWDVSTPWWLPNFLLRSAIAGIVGFIAVPRRRRERVRLTASALRGSTLSTALLKAVANYRGRYANESPSCFIFGHTHNTQPAEWVDHWMNLTSEASGDRSESDTGGLDRRIFNTGGWVIEPSMTTPDASYFIAVGPKLRLVRVAMSPDVVQSARAHADVET